jgi:hypothetical protein
MAAAMDWGRGNRELLFNGCRVSVYKTKRVMNI